MCYSDSPNFPTMRFICTDRAHDNRLDCGHNDYYNTNPPANSYLATHYNVADNPFLDGSSGPTPTGGPIVGVGGKCVDVNGGATADGTKIQLWTCNGTAAQFWSPSGQTWRAVGKCLEVAGGGTADGTKVQLWTCNGTGAQNWTSGANGSLVNPQSGKCLDASGGSSADGTQLIIWSCHGGTNQRWTLPA